MTEQITKEELLKKIKEIKLRVYKAILDEVSKITDIDRDFITDCEHLLAFLDELKKKIEEEK